MVSEADWYSLYFDKGYYQEGEAAARYLRRSDGPGRDAPVVQVLRDGPAGRDLAAGFGAARLTMGLPPARDLVVAPEQVVDAAFLTRLAAGHPGAVLALWLEPADLSGVAALAGAQPRPPLVFVSAGLLGDLAAALPSAVRSFTYITHLRSLPEDVGRSRLAVESWLKAKGLPTTHFEIRAKVYFIGWMLAGVVKMMRDDYYKETTSSTSPT